MLVSTTQFSIHVYDSDLSIHVCLSSHVTWHYITTRWEVLTPLDPHVQVSELGPCGFSQLLIRDVQLKRESSAEPYPSRPSCASLEFSFCKLVSVICIVHTYTSLCILAFAPIGDVIFL